MQGTTTETESSAIPTGDQRLSTVDVLKKARSLIEKPESWIKGSYGADADGAPACDGAISFCALGAIHKAKGENFMAPDAGPAFDFLERAMGSGLISEFNDARTHAEVLAAFDRAIELATVSDAHGNHVEQAPALEAKEA